MTDTSSAETERTQEDEVDRPEQTAAPVDLFERWLHPIFWMSGILSALFLVLIAVFVLAQIGGRLIGHSVPSADEFAGFCLSASSFLGLGFALRRGIHIRVTIVRDKVGPAVRVWLDRLAATFALLVTTCLTFYSWKMIIESISFGDMTEGLVPLPLWLPQSGMIVGVSVLSLAVAATCIRTWTGFAPIQSSTERIPDPQQSAV